MFNRKSWMIISLVLIAIGAVGAFNILFSGEEAMGISNEVPWGILIAGYVYFAVCSTGIGMVTSLGSVFGIKRFEIINKRSLFASLVILLCGFGILVLELGNPLNMINYFLSPNFTAPIWWMGVFYGLYLILLIFELRVSLKDKIHSRTIPFIALLVKLAAVSNLGAVFGMMVSRPYWHGAFFPIYMIMTAIVSGTAILSIIFYLLDRKGHNISFQGENLVVSLGKLYAAALVGMVIFVMWKILTAFYGAVPGETLAIKSIVSGPLSINFWIFEVIIGLLIPLVLVFGSNFNPSKVFTASLLTMIGMLFVRVNFVIAGQIIPLDPTGAMNTYVASWSEWAIIVGAVGVTIFLYLYGEKKFNLDNQVDEVTLDNSIKGEVQVNS